MKILVVEDETALSDSIVNYLRAEDYLCDVAANCKQALDKIDDFDYDCILLDITLPDGNGIQILREVRAQGKIDGVLIISARNSLDDRVSGLKLGADDYLPKPFHLSELGAGVAAIIRRKKFDGHNLVRINEITIDAQAKTVCVNEKPIDLTRKEYQLLLYFVSNRGRVISKNAMVDHLWGDEGGMNENFDIIYTHIKNLRKKLTEAGCSDYIHSVYGMGYKFSAS